MRVSNIFTLILYLIIILLLYFYFFKYLQKVFEFRFDINRISNIERIRFKSDDQTEILDDIHIDCEQMKKGVKPANYTPYKLDDRKIEDKLLYSVDRCKTLKSLYNFYDKPLSDEEADYPLAYGIMPYKDLAQVLFMLSSIYHPQNEYCIAVGSNANELFRYLLKDLCGCFPNVHYMYRPPIYWGTHEIINTVYTSMEFLSHLKSKWKYFQYLSGVDAPLKTNLEMVRIFKTLNGSANFELKEYQIGRLNGKNMSHSPLKLYKSSLSSLIPRASADYMASSSIPRQVLEFLKDTGIADEGFWGTLFGNKKKFDMPGSIDGIDFIEKHNLTLSASSSYYISRYQIWEKKTCGGYLTSGSCVYGIADLPKLLSRKELVAHKFYPTFEFDAYICLLKEIRKRSDNPPPPTNLTIYESLRMDKEENILQMTMNPS